MPRSACRCHRIVRKLGTARLTLGIAGGQARGARASLERFDPGEQLGAGRAPSWGLAQRAINSARMPQRRATPCSHGALPFKKFTGGVNVEWSGRP